MEDLFTTNISINHKSAVYQVIFENEVYKFVPNSNDNGLPSFSFKREHDEWHETTFIDNDVKKQALNALEKYLLAQH